MNKIVFFHHGHNGDMMHCQEFIRDIAIQLPYFKFEYHHPNNPKTSLELANLVKYLGPPLSSMSRYTRFVDLDNVLYVNCFVAAYGKYSKGNNSHPYYYEGGTNYVMLHNMWSYIYDKINEHFKTNIEIKEDKEYYFPTIEYKKFPSIVNIDDHINKNPGRFRILISNGRINSKQSFKGNMSEVICALALLNPDVEFIVTSPVKDTPKNVILAEDIIGESLHYEFYRYISRYNLPKICDLPELSYLSSFCKIIVGKNSGPFVFAMTKQNLMDKNKTFISFDNGGHYADFVTADTEIDSLIWGSKINSKYIHDSNYAMLNVFQTIQDAITEQTPAVKYCYV
jgi:hypothetical protein